MGGLWLCLVACGAFMAAGLQLLAQPRARRFPRGDAARARAPPALDEPRYALAALFPNPGRRPALPGPRATTSVYVPRFCRLPGGRVEFAATVGSFGALRRGALRFRNVLLTDVRSGAGDVAQHVWLRGDDALVVFAAVPEGAAFTFTAAATEYRKRRRIVDYKVEDVRDVALVDPPAAATAAPARNDGARPRLGQASTTRRQRRSLSKGPAPAHPAAVEASPSGAAARAG